MSVSITLEDDIDVSRGDMIVKENNQPQMEQDIDVLLCWLNDQGPKPGAKYTVRQATRETRAVIKDVVYKMDINSLQRVAHGGMLQMNNIDSVRWRTMKRLTLDCYRRNRQTGDMILVR